MTSRLPKLLMILTLIGLSGCGGVSGENGEDPFGSGDTSTPGDTSSTTEPEISLQILDSECEAPSTQSFASGDTLCLQATLSQNDEASPGQIVTFTSNLGTLSVSTKLTDSGGLAQIALSSDAAAVGAGTITAVFDTASAEANFEFLATDTTVIAPASIGLSMLNNGQAVNRFQADETVQLQAILLDSIGMPIEGEIIVFASGLGTLNTTDALTDNLGIAQVSLSPEVTDIGATVLSAQTEIDNLSLIASINVEIQSVDALNEDVIRFGHFTAEGLFIEGEIGVSIASDDGSVTISAGATLGVSVAIVDENDQRILTQTPIQFTSNCVADGLASIDLQVNTINGLSQATFEDINCAGSTGNTDLIVASLVVNNTTLAITKEISILAESVGSLQFISVSPQDIVLLGTGGQNSQSVSTLIFQVNGSLGNPLAQQAVDFSLNTQTGGLSLSSDSGITNSEGQVSTRVTAGNVPTSVRVTAQTIAADGTVASTQSDLLSVNTGLPDQNSFTFSADNVNPEAFAIDGIIVNLSARLADTFNNPVPDGTAISFTTEGGTIQPSCTTTNGTCNVTWTSSNPKVSDHRITLLATAIGHETLFDSNGNNSYDSADGLGFSDGTDSGFDNSAYGTTGFVDHSEAWRDDNEDGIKDDAEIFLDYNSNGLFDAQDSLFNGPQCASGSACGEGTQSTLHVRKALVLVTSSSRALIDILDTSDSIMFSNHQSASGPSLSLAPGQSTSFKLSFSDTAVQPIASGSTISIATTAGLLAGQIELTMPNTNKVGASTTQFTLTNDVTDPTTATVTATVTSPSGFVSDLLFVVALN